MKTFRVDRMREVKMKHEPREGHKVYEQMDIQSYCLQHFGMYSGDIQRITIQFTNDLLDTAVDRFGNDPNVFYTKTDKWHFSVTTDIALSKQFYGWLCGFWKKAVITSPPEAVEDFQKFLADIRSKYETE